ncbi:trypsin-like isoform X2 [Macrosteles quadrilineatus]|uniref:trypsin-like isoform X2 n=1 Tax=Macrosteles quadrilineatus TaxID=74068 RepID=UPI0023E13DCF|nr:trypsin-like isoform X2 [Macrosteles quadrilineatus]
MMGSTILTSTFLLLGIFYGSAFVITNEIEKYENKLRIINGDFTTIDQYPIDVAFLIANNIWGAGVIVGKTWVLTTAFNCLWIDPSYISIRAGSSNWTSQGSVILAEKCIIHPDYVPGTWANNIALVKLKSNIKFNNKSTKKGYYGPKTTLKIFNVTYPVSGWGVRSSNYTKEQNIQTIDQTILSDEDCSKFYNLTAAVGSFCASNANGGPCVFDFGAPLSRKLTVVGLYQGSVDCTQPETYPALYVDVFFYKDWIKETISK